MAGYLYLMRRAVAASWSGTAWDAGANGQGAGPGGRSFTTPKIEARLFAEIDRPNGYFRDIDPALKTDADRCAFGRGLMRIVVEEPAPLGDEFIQYMALLGIEG